MASAETLMIAVGAVCLVFFLWVAGGRALESDQQRDERLRQNGGWPS